MPLLVSILNVITGVSVIAYWTVLVFAIMREGGPIWRVYIWNVGFGLAASAASFVAIMNLDWSAGMNAEAAVAIWTVSLARLGCAITNVMLAAHLWRLKAEDADAGH